MTRLSADIVKVGWTGSGTASPITLGAAIDGFNVFPAALDGARVSYSIEHTTSPERESGVGIYTHSGTTLTRERVTASTNGGALVNFSAGTKHVRITVLAEDLYENTSTTDPTSADGRSQGYIAGRSRWLTADPDASPAVEPKLWICLNDDDVSSPSNVVWGRVVTADEIDELSLADNAVTNAKLADMAAWSFKIRNDATAGDPSDTALANLNEEASPGDGDFVLGFKSTGEIRVFGVGNLPASSGGVGSAANVGTEGVGVYDGESGSPPALGFRHIAPGSDKVTVVLNSGASPPAADILVDVVEANLQIPAESITSGSIADGRITASSVRQHQKFYKPINGTAAGSNITTIDSTHAGQTVKVDQNLTLDNTFVAEEWVIINNVHASSTITITVETGLGSPPAQGTINGSSTYQVPPGGEIMLRCAANPGDAPTCDARGDPVEINFGARVVWGNLAPVVTGVTGLLTVAAHLGCLVVTSGNITVPTTTGFHCLVKTGGAHTITFNGTVTGAATTGQVCSVMVQSATVVIITPWTTPQTLT